MLTLLFGLYACQTGQKTTQPVVSPGLPSPELEADLSVLTPIEEDIIRAFQFEIDKEWLQAAVVYDNLARASVQPERSGYLIKIALMYYRAGLYDEIDPYFDGLDEQDIEPADLKHKQIVQAGGYFGNGKIYQSLLALPEIEEIDDYAFKALALSIRSRGVLSIGKPLESARMRMQIREFLNTPMKIEENNDFIWEALNRISEPAMIRALSEPQTVETRGWLELNLIARRSNMLPVKMEPWIDKWYERYGEHPAAINYAIKLLEESKQVYIQPTRIALMLPFSGRLEKVAKAIQNGFLYAYYQDPGQLADLEIIKAKHAITATTPTALQSCMLRDGRYSRKIPSRP